MKVLVNFSGKDRPKFYVWLTISYDLFLYFLLFIPYSLYNNNLCTYQVKVQFDKIFHNIKYVDSFHVDNDSWSIFPIARCTHVGGRTGPGGRNYFYFVNNLTEWDEWDGAAWCCVLWYPHVNHWRKITLISDLTNLERCLSPLFSRLITSLRPITSQVTIYLLRI